MQVPRNIRMHLTSYSGFARFRRQARVSVYRYPGQKSVALAI
jgi:hypothetical protein